LADIEDMVIQMINDDKEAFNTIITLYYPKALRLAFLISGKYADSEDIVQEAFTSCYINRKKIKQPKYFETWLYKIISRKAWAYSKKAKREQPVEEVFEENTPDSFSLADSVIDSIENKEIFNAVMSLPIKQRTVVVLYYYNSLTTKEIAQITGSFEGTVKSRLHNARKSIRKIIESSKNSYEQEVPI
jgi:RNA polymerase sigma factor (sigma-70 family)